MIVKTGRFGQLKVEVESRVTFPSGLLGFPHLKEFCVVDPGDETLILWLQSTAEPTVAFPILEPRIFKQGFRVNLSGSEIRELRLEEKAPSAVYAILTIPEDVTQMTANLKAPIVINLSAGVGRQVVLQENEYTIKHPMFKELKAHILTIQAQANRASASSTEQPRPLEVRTLAPSPALSGNP